MKKFLGIIIFTFAVLTAAYSQAETILIFRETITYNEPRLSVLTRIENDDINKYILSNELFNSPYFRIELTEINFFNFREAFCKFLEWESLAVENNLDSFKREIPVTVISSNVTWSWTNVRHFTNKNRMTINFLFDWNPSRREAYRALLNISSNVIRPFRAGPDFTLQKDFMNHDEVSMFLDNITDENISLVVQENNERKSETERQRALIEELFF